MMRLRRFILLGLPITALACLALLMCPAMARAFMPVLPSEALSKAATPDNWTKWKEMGEKGKPLNPEDAGYNPGEDPPGTPQVPISCGEKAECRACYDKAIAKITKLRHNFEELRILYKETDDITKASIAFGDGMAGSTGVAALEWFEQRKRIKASFKGFEKAYRKKFNELLGRLNDALQEIAQCEARYFGEKDWYSRFGYMLHSFIAMHYTR